MMMGGVPLFLYLYLSYLFERSNIRQTKLYVLMIIDRNTVFAGRVDEGLELIFYSIILKVRRERECEAVINNSIMFAVTINSMFKHQNLIIYIIKNSITKLEMSCFEQLLQQVKHHPETQPQKFNLAPIIWIVKGTIGSISIVSLITLAIVVHILPIDQLVVLEPVFESLLRDLSRAKLSNDAYISYAQVIAFIINRKMMSFGQAMIPLSQREKSYELIEQCFKKIWPGAIEFYRFIQSLPKKITYAPSKFGFTKFLDKNNHFYEFGKCGDQICKKISKGAMVLTSPGFCIKIRELLCIKVCMPDAKSKSEDKLYFRLREQLRKVRESDSYSEKQRIDYQWIKNRLIKMVQLSRWIEIKIPYQDLCHVLRKSPMYQIKSLELIFQRLLVPLRLMISNEEHRKESSPQEDYYFLVQEISKILELKILTFNKNLIPFHFRKEILECIDKKMEGLFPGSQELINTVQRLIQIRVAEGLKACARKIFCSGNLLDAPAREGQQISQKFLDGKTSYEQKKIQNFDDLLKEEEEETNQERLFQRSCKILIQLHVQKKSEYP